MPAGLPLLSTPTMTFLPLVLAKAVNDMIISLPKAFFEFDGFCFSGFQYFLAIHILVRC
jgi:hypothetical protein